MIPLTLLIPEITLAFLALVLLLLGLYAAEKKTLFIENAAVACLMLILAMVWYNPAAYVLATLEAHPFNYFQAITKTLVLMCSLVAVWMGQAWFRGLQRTAPYEYYVLIMLSTVGMLLMISANSLLMLYIGLELQSLPLYILTAIRRDDTRTTEAALKYFILGALASGILLYGLSLLYGAVGSLQYAVLSEELSGAGNSRLSDPIFLFGLVFMIAGFAFKISAAPFHMWTPDVYQGAPLSVTGFLASAPKIAAIAMMLHFFSVPLGEGADSWRLIIILLAVLSVIVGAFTAIVQTNIMRLLAFSSIGHMGFVLMGISAASAGALTSVLYYMMIYMVSVLGVFAALLLLRKNNYFVSDINDLSGLSRTQPLTAFALAALFLSMAGIPPLAGFFGKLYVFQAALEQGLHTMVIAGVLASVVAAYYYLRLCKIMYFDDVIEAQQLDNGQSMRLLTTSATMFVVVFSLFPAAALYDVARLAAQALIP